MKRRALLKGALALPLLPAALEAVEQPLSCEVSSRMGVYRVIVRSVDTHSKAVEVIQKLHDRLRLVELDYPFEEDEWQSLLFIDAELWRGMLTKQASLLTGGPAYSQATYVFTPTDKRGEIEFRVFHVSRAVQAARADFFD